MEGFEMGRDSPLALLKGHSGNSVEERSGAETKGRENS